MSSPDGSSSSRAAVGILGLFTAAGIPTANAPTDSR
ncbi:hypothetical protein J2T22_001108 [Pseudarthrobacter defluvii]|uniref:Uncharacterized protein n=1 Tax=Pseudarthrobacter defluvii TaxID=410837 RepID=A0ABT9UE70_9MICC|nr:hypothetical protein [Pseudarthrobacter defluvii]